MRAATHLHLARSLPPRALRATVPTRRLASHGTPHYNEPSGWLFGEKVCPLDDEVRRTLIGDGSLPRFSCHTYFCLHATLPTVCWFVRPGFLYPQPLPPGQKREREDWEMVWYIGMFGSMFAAAVLLYYKPDTRSVLSVPSTRALLVSCTFPSFLSSFL